MRSQALGNSERTAHHLQSLYAVGAGLGVAVALENMFAETQKDPSLAWTTAPVVLAFLATLIPFFHGAMLFMDTAFHRSPVRVMIDFIALFSQTVLFFVMAEFVREPTSFGWALVTLLTVDVIWIIWLWASRGGSTEAASDVSVWGWINTGCVVVLSGALILWDWPEGPHLPLAALLAVIAIARTLLDYTLGRKAYFDPASIKADKVTDG